MLNKKTRLSLLSELKNITHKYRELLQAGPKVHSLYPASRLTVEKYIHDFCGLLGRNVSLIGDKSVPQLDLSHLHFGESFEFPKGIYPGIDLSGTRFADGCSFKDIEVTGESMFSVNSQKPIELERVRFIQNVSFLSCDLAGGGFRDVTFCGEVNFSDTKLKYIRTRTVFLGSVRITHSNLESIHDVRFESLVRFGGVFSSDVRITNCVFQKPADLSHTEFLGELLLDNCSFDSDVSFVSCKLRDHAVLKLVLFDGEVNFNSAEFGAPTEFERCTFTAAPTFFGTSCFPDTRFSACHFRNFSGEREASAYRVLRNIAHDSMKSTLLAGEFFALEQRSLSNSHIRQSGKRFQGVLSKLYGGLSEYGQSMLRPISWWLVSNAFFGVIFVFFCGATTVTDVSRWGSTVEPGLGLMFQNLVAPFAFFGKQSVFYPINGWFALASVIQSVLSLLLLALALLAIRRRFKKNTD